MGYRHGKRLMFGELATSYFLYSKTDLATDISKLNCFGKLALICETFIVCTV